MPAAVPERAELRHRRLRLPARLAPSRLPARLVPRAAAVGVLRVASPSCGALRSLGSTRAALGVAQDRGGGDKHCAAAAQVFRQPGAARLPSSAPSHEIHPHLQQHSNSEKHESCIKYRCQVQIPNHPILSQRHNFSPVPTSQKSDCIHSMVTHRDLWFPTSDCTRNVAAQHALRCVPVLIDRLKS